MSDVVWIMSDIIFPTSYVVFLMSDVVFRRLMLFSAVLRIADAVLGRKSVFSPPATLFFLQKVWRQAQNAYFCHCIGQIKGHDTIQYGQQFLVVALEDGKFASVEARM